MTLFWQVRHHLHLYAHSAAEAVEAAPVLVEPSPPCGADAAAIDELSAYDWLRRCGLERHAAALEEHGYTEARMLYGLKDSDFKDTCGIKDKLQLQTLAALAGTDALHARLLHSFTSPDLARVRADFLAAWAPATLAPATLAPEDGAAAAATLPLDAAAAGGGGGGGGGVLQAAATRFAKALCDRAGHGLIAHHQLTAFLRDAVEKRGAVASAADTQAAAAAAAEAAYGKLIEHTRPEKPPPPEVPTPTEWVYGWLKEHALEHLADKFIEAKMCTLEDLTLEPRLDLHSLRDVGVTKAGEMRKVFNLIKSLDKPGAEASVSSTGTATDR